MNNKDKENLGHLSLSNITKTYSLLNTYSVTQIKDLVQYRPIRMDKAIAGTSILMVLVIIAIRDILNNSSICLKLRRIRVIIDYYKYYQ
jgi:hypothetical protein